MGVSTINSSFKNIRQKFYWYRNSFIIFQLGNIYLKAVTVLLIILQIMKDRLDDV